MVVSLSYLGSFSSNYSPGSNLSPPCVGVTPDIELLDISSSIYFWGFWGLFLGYKKNTEGSIFLTNCACFWSLAFDFTISSLHLVSFQAFHRSRRKDADQEYDPTHPWGGIRFLADSLNRWSAVDISPHCGWGETARGERFIPVFSGGWPCPRDRPGFIHSSSFLGSGSVFLGGYVECGFFSFPTTPSGRPSFAPKNGVIVVPSGWQFFSSHRCYES